MNVDLIPTLVEDAPRLEVIYPKIEKATEHELFVEIGSFIGGNTLRVANKIRESGKDILLYTLDNFHFVNVSSESAKQSNFQLHGDHDTRQQDYYQTLMDNIYDCELQDYIIVLDGDSIELSKTFRDESIDLIFFDGAHDYPYVRDELKVWLPKVKTGGVISGHDYPCAGIQKAVKEILPNYQIKITSTNGAYFTSKI